MSIVRNVRSHWLIGPIFLIALFCVSSWAHAQTGRQLLHVQGMLSNADATLLSVQSR